MKELTGVMVALATPLSTDGEAVEYGRLEAHIDNMIEAGIHGIVPASGTGEYAYLSDSERKKVLETACKHINGRVTTVAQASGTSTFDIIERCKHAEQQGVDALMILPPFLEIPHNQAIIRHYEMIARAVSTPIIMYNVPHHAAGLDDDMYREMLAIENLDYIKDSSGDFSLLQKLIETGGGVLSGDDSFAPYAFLAGCKGMIWGAANFMPHECAQLYDLIHEGKVAEALELWESMKAIALWLGGNGHDVRYIPGIKAATRISGRDVGPARRPTPPVPGQARHEIRLAMSKLPVNRAKEDHMVWRNWSEERNWLIQNHKTQTVTTRMGADK